MSAGLRAAGLATGLVDSHPPPEIFVEVVIGSRGVRVDRFAGVFDRAIRRTEGDDREPPPGRRARVRVPLFALVEHTLGPIARVVRRISADSVEVAKVPEVVEGIIDLVQERDRLQKELAKVARDIEVFSKKLSNKNFVDKAPKDVVEKDTAKLEEFKVKREKLEQSLKVLG